MHPSSARQLSGKRASIRDQTSGPKSVVPLVLPRTSRATLEVLPIGSSCGVNRGELRVRVRPSLKNMKPFDQIDRVGTLRLRLNSTQQQNEHGEKCASLDERV